MTHKAITFVSLVALLLTGLLLYSVGPADAASQYDLVRSGAVLNYDDDETNSYVRIYTQVKKNRNGSYTQRSGYYPIQHRRITCSAGANIQSFYINPTSVYGYDRRGFHLPCRTAGTSSSKTFWPRGTDRRFNAYYRAYKRIVRDPHGYTRTRYAARR